MYIVWRHKPVKGTGGGPFLEGNPKDRNSDCRSPWAGIVRCDHSGKSRVAHTAVVVASERENGKPRQKLLFRFPTIRSCCVLSMRHRAAWWHAVMHEMEGWLEWSDNGALLEDLSRDRAAILAKLRKVVAKPSKAAADEFARVVAETTAERDRIFNEAWNRFAADPKNNAYTTTFGEAFAGFGQRAAGPGPSVKLSPPDPYIVLGLTCGATLDQVKSAHRKLAKCHHPDRGGDPKQFRVIQDAYESIRQTATARSR